MKDTINNHFIQKAFAFNFSNNNEIKCLRYKTDKKWNFTKKSTNQPISIKYFYSQEIEDSMNNIEAKGIRIIRKITSDANELEEVKITRKEIYDLKFYFLLGAFRSNGSRNSIANRSGDSVFNYLVEKDGRDAKSIQEESLKIIIDFHKNNKGIDNLNINSETNIKEQIRIKIYNILSSEIFIFKFKKNKLFLSESHAFNENTSYQATKYDFMPISPNVGLMFYYKCEGIELLGFEQEDSKIFKNKISQITNEINFKNISKINEHYSKYALKMEKLLSKNDIGISKLEFKKIFSSKLNEIYSNDYDQYIIKVLEENEETQDICNAMELIHSKNRLIIYQNTDDIKDAEFQIEKLNIFRIEDSN